MSHLRSKTSNRAGMCRKEGCVLPQCPSLSSPAAPVAAGKAKALGEGEVAAPTTIPTVTVTPTLTPTGRVSCLCMCVHACARAHVRAPPFPQPHSTWQPGTRDPRGHVGVMLYRHQWGDGCSCCPCSARPESPPHTLLCRKVGAWEGAQAFPGHQAVGPPHQLPPHQVPISQLGGS